MTNKREHSPNSCTKRLSPMRTYTESVLGTKAERLHLVFFKNHTRKRKKLASPQSFAGSPDLAPFIPCWMFCFNPSLLGPFLRGVKGPLRNNGGTMGAGRGKGYKKKEPISETLPAESANHQSRCWWRFRLRTDRMSAVNLSASSIGSRLRSAVSLGSLNQDLIGIALSG